MKRALSVLFVTALFLSPGVSWAARTKKKTAGSKKCLTKLFKELKGVLRKFPLKSQEQLRQQAIQAYTKDFANCLKGVADRLQERDRPVGSYGEIFADYLKGVTLTAKAFKFKKLRREQQSYLQAVQKVNDMKLKYVKPLPKGTTLQDAFNTLIKRLKRVQSVTRSFPSILQQKANNSVQKIFMLEVKQSDLGKVRERTKQWEKNAKLGRKQFPTSSAALKKRNERLARIVEQAAKRIFDVQSRAAKDLDE